MKALIIGLIVIIAVADFFSRVALTSLDIEPYASDLVLSPPNENGANVNIEKIGDLFGEYEEPEIKVEEPEANVQEVVDGDSILLNDTRVRIVMIASVGDKYSVILETLTETGSKDTINNVKIGQQIRGFRVEKIESDSITFTNGVKRIQAVVFKVENKELS